MSGDSKHPSDNQPDGENSNPRKTNNKGVRTKARNRTVIFWSACAAQIPALVTFVSMIGHKYAFLGLALSLVYFSVVSAIAYRQLIHQQAAKQSARNRAGVVLCCGLIPTALISLYARHDLIPSTVSVIESPKPHFHLAFLTSDPSGIAVLLDITNKCFISQFGMPSFGARVGILNIPVSDEHRLAHTNFSEYLSFVLINDSEIDGGISEIVLDWGSESIRIPLSDGWTGRVPGEWRTDALTFSPSPNFVVIHRDGKPLPVLNFDRINLDLNPMHSGTASFNIKQPNAPDAVYSFVIRFVSDTNMRAFITETDNPIGSNIGAMRITFPPRNSN